ncbi:MAG TPA: hypothetical protein VGX69_00720, partial [Solirubrobacteraceae bacterium]|nr:hypothetical protein [Solirubrobacteraceae bacterium]
MSAVTDSPVSDTPASTAPAESPATAPAPTPPQEPSFSLALTQDQKDIRDWVHGFAADVMRPAA